MLIDGGVTLIVLQQFPWGDENINCRDQMTRPGDFACPGQFFRQLALVAAVRNKIEAQ